MNKINKKRKKGFTLIELVIVLAVLAIIALIAIPNFTKVRQDSLRKADTESCNQIKKITLMSIANEDIIVPTTGGSISISFSGATASPSETGVTFPTSNTNYQQYLKDVKKPQYKNSAGTATYNVTITGTGDVTVITSVFDPASPSP